MPQKRRPPVTDPPPELRRPIVLVVDPDRSVLRQWRKSLRRKVGTLLTVHDGESALAAFVRSSPEVVIVDCALPDESGLDAIQRMRRADPTVPFLVTDARGSSETAMEAMKAGAVEYFVKPLNFLRLEALVGELVDATEEPHDWPAATVGSPPATGGEDRRFGSLLGGSPGMLAVYQAVGRVAPLDVSVLITGESGTGKELVARALYQHSRRADRQYLAVNCAAIPDSLLESELFGFEKGAFTGAERRRIGKFEQCSGGTIFLDEVGDMSPTVQSKIVRLLQDQTFERVGGNETIRTDVRIIAATNRDLESMSDVDSFRSDLYYRLNGYSIAIPPLRERGGDIGLLLDHFIAAAARETGKPYLAMAATARRALLGYPWPGNVREMQSIARQTVLHAKGRKITLAAVPEVVLHWETTGAARSSAVRLGTRSTRITSDIHDSLIDFRRSFPDPFAVAFLMMQFGRTKAHNHFVTAIRKAFARHGIRVVRADEYDFSDSLFPNVKTYMHGCGLGIAVFERIEKDDFNPNVSLEVGYMLALGKPVCLLKDRTLSTLPTDLTGKLYKEFDTQRPEVTIHTVIDKWVSDNGLSRNREPALKLH